MNELSEQDIEELSQQQPLNDIYQLPSDEQPTENQITYIHTNEH